MEAAAQESERDVTEASAAADFRRAGFFVEEGEEDFRDEQRRRRARRLQEITDEIDGRRRRLFSFRNRPSPRRAGDPAHDGVYQRIKCGPNVWDMGDEIHMRCCGHPTKAQIEAVIRCALAKGWTDIYVFSRNFFTNGEPHIQMGMMFNQVIQQMGLAGRIRCCVNPQELGSHWEMQERLRRQRLQEEARAAPSAAAPQPA